MAAERKFLPLLYRHRIADVDRFLIAAARHQDAPQHQQRQEIIYSPNPRGLFQRFPLRFGTVEAQLARFVFTAGAASLKRYLERAQTFRFGAPMRQRPIGGQLLHLLLQLPVNGGDLGRLDARRQPLLAIVLAHQGEKLVGRGAVNHQMMADQRQGIAPLSLGE